MDVARFEAPKKWEDVLDAVKAVLADTSVCKTLAVDTADWAEMLCIKYTCDKAGVKGIEDFGYGKGYTYLQENFKQLLDLLEKVISAGINVVITAHAKMRKFEQPDEMGAYDRWEMKLSRQVAPMLKEWADMVLFANYKTYVVEYEQIKKVIEPEAKAAAPAPKKTEKKPAEKKPEPKQEPKAEAPKQEEEPDYIKELRALMAKDDISEERLILACASKGVCWTDGKIADLSKEFIKDSLIAKWPGFAKYARKIDVTADYIPFDTNNKEEKK